MPLPAIDCIDSKWTPVGKLGLMRLPGGGDGNRLEQDLQGLVEQGVDVVVCLVEQAELKRYGVSGLLEEYGRIGLEVFHLPIPDMGVVPIDRIKTTAAYIAEQLAGGKYVVVHCVGGLGRSGMVAACYLKNTGFTSQQAIDEVRRARSPQAIETVEQERLVRRYTGGTENGGG